MKPNQHDCLRRLFAALPDEPMPTRLNKRIMRNIYRLNAPPAQQYSVRQILGYAAAAFLPVVCCFCALRFLPGFPQLPAIQWPDWTFPYPDFSLLKSPAFRHSLHIGTLTSILLLADFLIRRRLRKKQT